jgi:hypothetical protein
MSVYPRGSIGVYVDDEGDGHLPRVQKLLAGIPGGVYKAVGSAFARAAAAGKNKAGKMVAEEYAINQSTFKEHTTNINHFRKDGQSLEVVFGFRGHVVPLIRFDTKVTKDGHVKAGVKRGGTKAVLDKAFVAQVGGHTGVYERLTSKRYPLKQLFGPSTAQMLNNEDVLDRMDETIRATYDKRLEHEISRILQGIGV